MLNVSYSSIQIKRQGESMSDVKCPECNSNAILIAVGINEFNSYRCEGCEHEFREPPEPELIAAPFKP